MKNILIIDRQLPSLNDYIHKLNNHYQTGAKFKRETEDDIIRYIWLSRVAGTLCKVTEYPVEINIEWHEKDEKRDVDNIKSAVKFILDAMQSAQIIENDGRKFITQIHDTIVNDKKTFVVVEITTAKTENGEIK